MEYTDKRLGPGATRRRPFPTRLARYWAVAWAVSIALSVATRTVAQTPVVALLRWIAARSAALPAHPTLDTLPLTLALPVLLLVVVAVVMAPLLIPGIAAVHVAVAWARGGGR